MLNKKLAGSTCATWTVLRGARRRGVLGVSLALMALTVGSISAQAQTPCVQPPCGMVSWWPGDQNPNDIVDENDGTLIGSYAPGMVDWAFSFAAAGDGVEVLNAANLNFGPAGCAGSDLSIDAWIFVDTNLPGYTATVLPIVDKRSNPLASTAVGYFLFLYNGKLAFQLGDSVHGFYNYISSGPDLLTTGWHHVAVTVDRDSSTGGNLYMDGVGVLPFDPTNRQGSLINGEGLLIGRHAGNPNSIFIGRIDEVEIFNRALSQPEIQDIFDAQSAGKCKGDCVSAPLGMVSWWPGDDNPNDIVDGNPGTLLGTADYGPGMVGKAFRFVAAGDCVRVSPATNLNFGTAFVPGDGDLSIDAWIWVDPLGYSYAATVLPIVDKRSVPVSPQSIGYFLFLYNGRLAFQLGDGTFFNYISPSSLPDLRDGAWHHVVVTVDRDSATGGNLYVDGVGVLNFNPTNQLGALTNSQPLFIGRHAASSNPSFIGLIDEVEIFSRPLSPQEVWDIFNAGSAGKCKCYGGLDLTISTGPCSPWLITQVPFSGSTLQVGPAPLSTPGVGCLWLQPSSSNVAWVGTSCPGATGPGTYVYEYTFCLCDCYSNVQMKFRLWAEDSAKVFLNGPQIFGTPSVPLPDWWSAPWGYLVEVSSPNCATLNGFVIGVNTLRIEVSNASPGPSGMMLSGWIGAYVGRCCP
jgi:hypothetical protein